MEQMTVERLTKALAKGPVAYRVDGHVSPEGLLPVVWDDGEAMWQLTSPMGNLVGFWRVADPLDLGPVDKLGTFTVADPTATHLTALIVQTAPHRNCCVEVRLEGKWWMGANAWENGRMVPVLTLADP